MQDALRGLSMPLFQKMVSSRCNSHCVQKRKNHDSYHSTVSRSSVLLRERSPKNILAKEKIPIGGSSTIFLESLYRETMAKMGRYDGRGFVVFLRTKCKRSERIDPAVSLRIRAD